MCKPLLTHCTREPLLIDLFFLHLAQFCRFFKTLLWTPPSGSFPRLTFLSTIRRHLQTVLGAVLNVSFMRLCIKIVHLIDSV